ncbi:MAG: hypothetical protein K5883_06470 [Pseudobutyrivibrio sp.]|nr:hypothetical protein [Pseudobutyrivibrio sp.]
MEDTDVTAEEAEEAEVVEDVAKELVEEKAEEAHEHEFTYAPFSARTHKVFCVDGDYESVEKCTDEDHDGHCDICGQSFAIDDTEKNIMIVENYKWEYTLSSGSVIEGTTPQYYGQTYTTDNEIVYTEEILTSVFENGDLFYDASEIDKLNLPEELPSDTTITYDVTLDGTVENVSVDYVASENEEEDIEKLNADLLAEKEKVEILDEEAPLASLEDELTDEEKKDAETEDAEAETEDEIVEEMADAIKEDEIVEDVPSEETTVEETTVEEVIVEEVAEQPIEETVSEPTEPSEDTSDNSSDSEATSDAE